MDAEQVLGQLSLTLTNQQLVTTEGQEVIGVTHDYARSWSLLQGYDKQSLVEQAAMRPLNFEEALKAIVQLKQELVRKGEASELFGQRRGGGLASAIATIEHGFGEEFFYPNVASRATNLLYSIT